MCEWCASSGRCSVCDWDHESARCQWEDDGGRAIDHDAETPPKVPIPLEDRTDELVDRVAFWMILVGGTLWVGAFVFAMVFYGRR